MILLLFTSNFIYRTIRKDYQKRLSGRSYHINRTIHTQREFTTIWIHHISDVTQGYSSFHPSIQGNYILDKIDTGSMNIFGETHSNGFASRRRVCGRFCGSAGSVVGYNFSGPREQGVFQGPDLGCI